MQWTARRGCPFASSPGSRNAGAGDESGGRSGQLGRTSVGGVDFTAGPLARFPRRIGRATCSCRAPRRRTSLASPPALSRGRLAPGTSSLSFPPQRATPRTAPSEGTDLPLRCCFCRQRRTSRDRAASSTGASFASLAYALPPITLARAPCSYEVSCVGHGRWPRRTTGITRCGELEPGESRLPLPAYAAQPAARITGVSRFGSPFSPSIWRRAASAALVYPDWRTWPRAAARPAQLL